MATRHISILTLIGIACLGLVSSAQGPQHTASASHPYTAPRNAFGQPDLEGRWENNSITPLQRPAEWAGKTTLTEAEVRQLQAASRRLEESGDALFGDELVLDVIKGQKESASHDTETGNYNAFWLPNRDIDNRTSLIIDPADGRIPPLTPQAQARRAAVAEQRRLHPADGPESRGLSERCITFGVPRFGAAYSSVYEIVQAPDAAVFRMETIHDARVIPLDARPHLPGAMQQWMGNSRGHWEGETLVVETANFNGKNPFQGSSENMRLVERFTRVDENTMRYQFTIDDPSTWARPWSAEVPWAKTIGPLFEHACHEGNLGLYNILAGARVEEKRAAEGAAPKDGAK
jgi:hypothetical protein